MGYSLAESIHAGAIVQQYQNYTYPNHPDGGDKIALLLNLADSTITGNGENADDIVNISKGYNYAKDVYLKDPNRNSNEDSCQSNSNSSGSQGYSEGIDSTESYGYGGVNFIFTLPAGCYGSCGGGYVTITDLPNPYAQH